MGVHVRPLPSLQVCILPLPPLDLKLTYRPAVPRPPPSADLQLPPRGRKRSLSIRTIPSRPLSEDSDDAVKTASQRRKRRRRQLRDYGAPGSEDGVMDLINESSSRESSASPEKTNCRLQDIKK